MLSPLLVGWPLRARLWAAADWMDPYLHTAVVQHGRDLLERFGADNRQFARAGFTVPGRLFNLAFGDVGGYLAFRYFLALVAVVPAYLLFRRLYGRAAGAVAVVAVLANPVVLLAWGSDYGDCSAVSYLVAGTCCLVMPAASPGRRTGWLTLAGVALSLALHSMFVTLPLIGGLVLAHAALTGADRLGGQHRAILLQHGRLTGADRLGGQHRAILLQHGRLTARRSRREALTQLGLLAAVLVATTGVLVVIAKLLFGAGDIVTPTWTAYQRLRMPDQVTLWHSPSGRWALADPHLLVPPAAIAAWAAARWRRGAAAAERTIVLAAALQSLAYGYLQFLNTEQTLEFYLYLSLLWPAVVLVSAFAVVAVAERLLGSGWTAWVPATLVLLAPLALHPFREQLVFRVPWLGLLLAVGLLATAAVAGAARVRPHPARALMLCAALVVGSYVLLTGKDTGKPWLPGQVHYPPPHYAGVIGMPYGQQRDEYAAASQLHHVVPAAQRPGTPLLLWWTRTPFSSAVNITAAQYGWNRNALHGSLPTATPADLTQIRQWKPDYLGLLSTTGREFDAAVRTLARAGVPATVTRTATLHHRSATVFVQVVRVGAGSAQQPGRPAETVTGRGPARWAE